VKVALVPTLTYVAALLGVMILRATCGASPLPNGLVPYVTVATGIVTMSSIAAAGLLRFRLG
jgi:hypothetical protein